MRGRQGLLQLSGSNAGRCFWLVVSLTLVTDSLLAATRLPDFPAKPADMGQASWEALQSVVVQTIPVSSELTASDGAAGDDFGYQVALSGTTALVGAITKTVNSHANQGAAYVFTFDGSSWIQQQELTASDGAANDHFGNSVAVSGTTALVGATGPNGGQGAAYVFVFNGSTWVQQQELTAGDGAAGDEFGFSVALSGDTALVGAINKTINSHSFQGAAYVFTFSGSTWIQQQELTAGDGAALDKFGSVALSGTTALVGAPYKMIGSNSSQGAAYVFTSSGGSWIQQQELTASDGTASDVFGRAVALSGSTALIGAYGKTINSNYSQGAAYVFTSNGSSWSQQQQLTAGDGATSDRFGATVALSGPTALVGAFSKTIGANGAQGAAYLFTSNGNAWVQQQELTASDGNALDEFGIAVALSGTTALVGAPYATSGGTAYVFGELDAIFCDGFDGMGVCM